MSVSSESKLQDRGAHWGFRSLVDLTSVWGAAGVLWVSVLYNSAPYALQFTGKKNDLKLTVGSGSISANALLT